MRRDTAGTTSPLGRVLLWFSDQLGTTQNLLETSLNFLVPPWELTGIFMNGYGDLDLARLIIIRALDF